MANRVAVVTGANKGIGYGIVKELCKRGVTTVYLIARNKTRGEKAVMDLEKEGFYPIFYHLDVTDRDCVKALGKYLKEKHGGLDILINNAAIPPEDFRKTTYEDSKRVINTNYYSILIIQEYIFPVLKDNARVLNISSDCGHISNLRSQYWIKRLIKEDINVEDINAFVTWFLESIKNASLNSEDFVEISILAYRVSKIALCALTRVQQRAVRRGISINSLHPGFTKTDMTKNTGVFTFEEASQTPVYLVLDADQSLKGQYIWFDKSVKDWTDTRDDLCCRMDNIMKSLGEIANKTDK